MANAAVIWSATITPAEIYCILLRHDRDMLADIHATDLQWPGGVAHEEPRPWFRVYFITSKEKYTLCTIVQEIKLPITLYQ